MFTVEENQMCLSDGAVKLNKAVGLHKRSLALLL